MPQRQYLGRKMILSDAKRLATLLSGTSAITGITKTVGPTTEDFTTIQAAVNWFKARMLTGANKIDITAGQYFEDVLITDIFCGNEGSLELEGDTRVLAGLSYVDGANCSRAFLTNGGQGVVTLSNAGNIITVACATLQPDFDADGWIAGDKVIIYDNTGTFTKYTLASALNNTLTLTVAAPAVGNDGTAIVLCPNVEIAWDTPMYIESARGILLDGLYLEPSGGQNALDVEYGAFVRAENLVVYHGGTYGIMVSEASTLLIGSGAISVWNSDSYGIYCDKNSYVLADYVVVVGGLLGILSFSSIIYCSTATVADVDVDGFQAMAMGFLGAWDCTARQCGGNAYYAGQRGYVAATSTNAQNNGNGTNYSPAASDAFGNNNGSITWS